MTRRLALVLCAVAALLGLPGPAMAATQHPAVVVVGIAGLRWDQVSPADTPTLWRLARAGSAGSLSIRSADATTCVGDGWLTVGAGNRVRVPDCATPTAGADGPVASFADIVRVNHRLHFGAVPGTLASALGTSSCVAAVGPRATLGAADRSGVVTHYWPTVSAQALASCPVTLVDGGTVTDRASAARADTVLARIDGQRPPGSVLLVVGLADLDPRDRNHLHVAIAAGGPYGPGALRSQSTRRAPYVQLIDVAATVLELRGAAADSHVDGQPWRTSGQRPPSVATLAEQDLEAGAAGAALGWVAAAIVVVLVAGVGLVLFARRRAAGLLLLTALAAPAMTYLANLIPWYDAPLPTLALIALTLALAGALAVPAFVVGEKRSWIIAAGLVCAVTFAVMVADLLTGAHLQLDSVLGYSPLVAGRFAGVGNTGYGVLAGSAVLLATAVAIKRPGVRAVAAIGAVAVVVDGAPMWGSDVGGVLALVPGFGLLVLLCSRQRLSAGKLVALGTSAVAVVTAFALADYARPASDQTHLGRFVGKVLHGGAATLLDRKWHSDVGLLVHNAATLTVPLLVAGSLWAIMRPRPRLARTFARHPELRYGLIALAVVSLVGLVVNDSGIVIPAVAALLAIPYTLVTLTGDIGHVRPSEDQHVLP